MPTPERPCRCGGTLFNLPTMPSVAGRLVAVGFETSAGIVTAHWRCDRCGELLVLAAQSRKPEGEPKAYYAADIVAHVVERVLETHARAGTDLKSALEGMAINYRARAPQALRVVRDALEDADRRRDSRKPGDA